MKDNYVVYKGVRMTEQEAEARINDAYCNAADKARNKAKTTKSPAVKRPTAKRPTAKGTKK